MPQNRRRFRAALLFCIAVFGPFALKPAAGPLPDESFPPEFRWQALAGTRTGLYGLSFFGALIPLRTGGEVRKIIRAENRWITLGSEGILVSGDLRRWESRNRGLPRKTIKVFRDGTVSFERVVQEIKDLELNPFDSEIMACATKDRVFLSRDGGRSWRDLGMPAYRTNGIKAVAVTSLTGASGAPELCVFLSHSTYGIHILMPDRRGALWTELNGGIEPLETTGNADEVSDILCAAPEGNPVVYAAQTFRPRIYRLDWEGRRFERIWSGGEGFGTADSLSLHEDSLRFIREGAVVDIPRPGGPPPLRPERRREDLAALYRSLTGGEAPLCLGLWERGAGISPEFYSLSELWLLGEGEGPEAARRREGLYLPANHIMEERLLRRHLATMEDRGLNMIVIDMKDDYGRLRFVPENPELAEKGRVFRPVDIDAFLADMKQRGVYTAARIVVFKDPELARKENGRYALWDRRRNRPWRGYYDARRLRGGEREETALETETFPDADPAYEIVRTYYDEQWVDPYSEEVWEYTALLAEELHRRGFDEIQFDYIRFPTDGQNLEDARYRWQDSGMDMESAMLSFLRHVRSRLDCPVSVDIYGANGWYRTGARTGQEVELMAPYVDVICPMYYPSHFEQDFLAQPPAENRPYRIYYQGVQRTARIARGRIIVRPYVQAFYLNVAYDRRYYNESYVLREVWGVRDAGDGGLTYWNNAGRYDDVPPRDGAAP